MRIGNPGKLLITDVDDPSQGFEQLTVLMVIRLHHGGHPTLFPDASVSRRLEKQGRTRRRKTPKATGPLPYTHSGVVKGQWPDALSVSWVLMKCAPARLQHKARDKTSPRNQGVPSPTLNATGPVGKAKTTTAEDGTTR